MENELVDICKTRISPDPEKLIKLKEVVKKYGLENWINRKLTPEEKREKEFFDAGAELSTLYNEHFGDPYIQYLN